MLVFAAVYVSRYKSALARSELRNVSQLWRIAATNAGCPRRALRTSLRSDRHAAKRVIAMRRFE